MGKVFGVLVLIMGILVASVSIYDSTRELYIAKSGLPRIVEIDSGAVSDLGLDSARNIVLSMSKTVNVEISNRFESVRRLDALVKYLSGYCFLVSALAAGIMLSRSNKAMHGNS
jgi:hypothetical protein